MTQSPVPTIEPAISKDASKARAKRSLTASLILLLVGLGVGGWMYLHRGAGRVPSDAGPLQNVIADSPPGVQPRWFGFRRPPNPRNALQNLARRAAAAAVDGVAVNGNGYLVSAGTSHLEATPAARNGQWQYRYYYLNEQIATPAQIELYQAMAHAREPAIATKAGVTTDQLDKLRKVPGGGMVVAAADRENIGKLFTAWLNAAGRNHVPAASQPTTAVTPASAKPAETALVKALGALGQKQLAPSKQNAADRAAQIRSILGDAEIAKLK